MARLNVNITDAKDLITQSKNLTNAERKEAQIARLYINQCKMPNYSEGASGKFVMMENVGFKSKTMQEPAFLMGLTHAGVDAGLKEQDVIDTYDNEAIAMALCNYIQKQTMAKLQNMDARQINAIADRIEENLEIFGKGAREAKVNLGVVIATEQQVKQDLAKIKELAVQKEDSSNEK